MEMLRVLSHVFLELIKDEGHPKPIEKYFFISLEQLITVYRLVIAQESPNHCDTTVPSRFLLTNELLAEFLALFYRWSDEDPCIYLCL